MLHLGILHKVGFKMALLVQKLCEFLVFSSSADFRFENFIALKYFRKDFMLLS